METSALRCLRSARSRRHSSDSPWHCCSPCRRPRAFRCSSAWAGRELRRLGEFGPELDHAVVGDLLPIHRRQVSAATVTMPRAAITHDPASAVRSAPPMPSHACCAASARTCEWPRPAGRTPPSPSISRLPQSAIPTTQCFGAGGGIHELQQRVMHEIQRIRARP